MKRKFLHSKMQFGILFSGCSRLAIRTMATVTLLLLCSTIWAQTRLYVDVDAVGSNAGNSWGNAYTSLKDAINAAREGDEIWVAAGTYKPTADNDRTISFNLKSGVAIYGGFAGTETSLNERNMSANETILSGDIGITGDKSDNSYHVIYNEYVQNTTILDGFTITNGYSSDEYGSGIYNRNSYPQLTNLIITGNKSRDGGGIYNYFSSPELVNCLIVNNSADGGGGGLCNENSSPVLTNCTIFGNSAMGGAGGGIKSSSSNPILYNTIVWGNVANSNGQQFSSSYSTVTLNNSCYGNKAGDVYGTLTTNANCITTDPLFINPNNDFHLAANSPCLDAGDDTYNNQPIDIRGAGFGRKLLKTDANSAGTIDIGAYEFKKGTDTETAELLRLYVNAYVSGGTGDGSSWANAYTSLQQAITDAGVCYEIWVAAGTYKPTTDNDRTISFNLKSGVAIYGGFAGDETLLEERNISANETILSGDIGTPNVDTDNSYHVIYNNRVLNAAILDGFTVVNGNGDNSNDGGGIYNLYSSPKLRNLIITGNKSNFGGGIYNSSSSPAITNCVIIKNEVLRNGGGIYNSSSSPSITNCTIANNEAEIFGGGIYNDYSSPNLNNTIVWGNTSGYSGQQIYVSGGTTKLNNSCYANEANDVYGTLTTNANCITTNPQFVNPNNDFRLAANSPCLDAGDDTYNDQSADIRGADFSRKLLKTDASSTGAIDMGAYEFKKGTDPETPDVLRLYVNANVSGGTGDGSSWANAYTSLRQAITDAERHYEIWVAAGTYKPTTNTDCSISFNLKNDVAIYGGFAGTEALLEERNMSANVTILSGDIRSTGHNQSYHVIFNENVLSTAILDGFTITNGKSVYTGSNFSDQFGGGIYNSNSSPQLRNLIITGNSSQYGGGIYNTNSSPILVNCLIVSNTTNGSGGGINNNGYSFPILTNCTVTYNSASSGGGVFNEINSKPILNNTIVWGNTAENGGQQFYIYGEVTLNNSCYSNEANDVFGTLTTNANCITVNPKFVNRTNDFRLAANSPCIDAGNDAYNDQTTDIRGAGFGRKLLKTDANSAGTIDMGAYEFKNGTDPEAPDLFRLYVDVDAKGNGDGHSWANAYTSLKDAISAAYEDYEIWVAAGTYYPTIETVRGISFNLKNGVAIYGGFAGTETSLNERNVSSNATILSGDIGTPNVDTDNSYFVVYNNNVSNTAILDGFTITKGNGGESFSGGGMSNNNSSPQLSNLIITGNYSLYGGGIYNNGSSPTISNCTISNNEASRGGGIYNTNSSPILVNCLIVNNTARGTGGGFYNTSSSPTLTNCTVAANSAIAGGGVYNEANSNSILNNTILWHNRASNSGQQIYISEATATLNNSCYGNETNDVYGTLTTNANCLTNDPLFINPNNDFRLAANSPCLDAGDNTYNSQPTDIRGAGFDRKLLKTDANSTGTIDMGAYEFKKGTDTETTEPLRLYVNANVSGGAGDGSSWANAYTSLKQAITDAGWYYEIWVAAGTYKPTSDTDRDISFNLKNGVAIYGGFAGTETSFDERNVSSNVTILSGDIGTPNVDTDNSYFVVYNNEVSNKAILDGFTITKGYGEGAKTGGGMYNYNSSPQLSNLIITGNYSAANGGGMYNYWMSEPTMNNCTISENKAKVDGGGIYNSVSSNLTMNNCTIANNESLDVDGGDGGGVYNVNSSPILNNCTIENNTTKKMGGGIYNSTFSTPTFNNCIISGNTAGFSGGGMFNNSSSPVLFNCLIISNTSEGSGGGLCNFDAGSTLTNCTILGNSAQNGGGVYNEVDSHTTLNNTIVWGNTAIAAGQQLNNNSGTIALNNSCYGNETNDVSGTLTTNDNCITSDPEFVDVAGSDFRIQGISPCKNNGDNSYNSTASDIRGQERIQNTTIDMGAYEWTSGLDPEPFISIAATIHANEDATNGQFTISVDKELKIDLTVNLTLSGTAADGIDMNTMAKSVVIPAGSLSVTTPVELIPDAIAEGDETVTLTLGTNSGVPIGATVSNSPTKNEATVTITDNDTSVEVSIAATTPAEEDATNGFFTVSVDKKLSTDLTVNLTSSGTADEGVDMDNLSTSVLIPAGEFSVTTPVNVISDNLVEDDETVIYTLGDNSGAPIGVSVNNSLTAYQDVVTITDDDYATLRVTKIADAYENISNGVFSIITDKQFNSNVDVNISVSGTAIAGADYSPIVLQQIFPANTDALTVTVAQLDDLDSEINEYVILKLVSTNNTRVSIAPATDDEATVTVFDDETIQLTVEDPVLTLSKVYDGNATAAVTPGLLTNLVPGDDVILEATATYNDSEAGAGKTITVSYSISGNDASGYHAPVNFTTNVGEITPATLTVTAHNQSKVYGEPNPALTFEYGGFVNNDDATDLDAEPDVVTNIYEYSNAGSYLGAITFNGGWDNNYEFDFVYGDFEITKATLTVVADGQTKVYGESNPELTFYYEDWANGEESIDVAPSISTTIDETSDANYYTGAITLNGGSDNNYTFVFEPGDFEITKAPLTVTAHKQTKVYGQLSPALTIEYDGFVNEDDANDLDEQPVAVTDIDEYSDAEYYSEAITFSGGSDNNYDLSFVSGDFEITKATLTVTAHNQSKVYGDFNPVLTFKYSGFVNNDDATDLEEQPAVVTNIDTDSNAGSYPDAITFWGGWDNNYEMDFVAGDFEITKATLTVIADDQTKVYGESNPVLTLDYIGFVNLDNADDLDLKPIASTSINELSHVGSYPNSIILSGGEDNNYVYSLVPGNFDIIKAQLEITADNKSKVYGQSDPEFTISFSGFVNGDDASDLTTLPTINIDGDGINVGEYDILVAGAQANNYEITYVNGMLNIDKALLTVSANNQSAKFNQAIPELTITCSGFVNDDDISDLITAPTASTVAVQGSPEGDYDIEVSGGVSNNYNFNYLSGIFTITPKLVPVINWNAPADIVYGTHLSDAQLNAVALVDNEIIEGTFTYSPDFDAVLNAGDAKVLNVMFTPTDLVNYVSVTKATTVNVTKATLTVTADDKSKMYGEFNPELTFSYSGWVNGEETIDEAPSISTEIDDLSNAGTYADAITLAGGLDNNYIFNFVAGDFEIEKASLDVIAHSKTKVYGQSNPELTFEYDGWMNGVEAIDVAPTITTSIDNLSEAGDHYGVINLTGGSDNNYNLNFVAGNFEITKAQLTVTADNKTKVYGQSNPEFTFQCSGWVNGDDESDLDEKPVFSASVDEPTNAGNYPGTITEEGGSDNNYELNFVSGNYTVTKATLTVTANNQTKVYGSANPELTFTYGGWVNGDDVDDLDEEPSISTMVDAASNAGTYTEAITLTGGSDNNYTLNLVAGNFEITKATLVARAENKSIYIDQAMPALTVSYSGFVNSEDVSVLDSEPLVSTTATETNVAATYPITVSGGSDNNYSLEYAEGVLTISDKEIPEITWAAPSDITYGTALGAAQLNASSPVAGTFTYAPASGEVLNAGNAQTLNVHFVPDNTVRYSETDFSVQINVNKAALQVTANDQSKVYGESTPVFAVSYQGFVNGDNENSLITKPTASVAAGDGIDVGNYAIAATGGSSSNYTFSYVSGNFEVTKATLTITADNKAANYNQPLPALSITYTGFVNGDDAEDLTSLPTISTTAVQGSPEGDYAITVSGAESDNYTFNYVPGILTISPKQIPVITWDTPSDIVYGTALSSTQLNAVAVVDGSTIEGSYVYTPALGTVLNAGNSQNLQVAFTPSDATLYESVVGTVNLNVTKAPLSVTADDKTITYGETIPVLTVSYSGFVNGDAASVLNIAPVATLAAGDGVNAGNYTISFSEGSDDNYAMSYNSGDLVVNKAQLTVAAVNDTITYGESIPELAISYTGFVNGESASVLTVAPVASLSSGDGVNAGSCNILLSEGSDENYEMDYNQGVFVVNKATLSVTADDKTKVYGSANPDFTLTFTGFVSGDNASVLDVQPTATCPATTTSNVGTYTITASNGHDNNYEFNYVSGKLVIGKSTITVIADNKNRLYGRANPVLTLTYSGFSAGDNASALDVQPVASTLATRDSDVGSYEIVVSGGSDNNYDILYRNGKLDIEQGNANIFSESKTIRYGEPLPEFTIRYEFFDAVGKESDLDHKITAWVNADSITGPGTYPIHISGGKDNNYALFYIQGTLTVEKALLTVTAESKTITYGEHVPELAYTIQGFLEGDNDTVLASLPTVALVGGNGSNAGVYEIVASGGSDEFYEFDYRNGSLTVKKAPLTVTAANATSTVGTIPTFDVTYSGFVNGESKEVIDTLAFVSTTATIASPSGAYPINVSGGSDNNYEFTYINGQLRLIEKVTPVISWVPSNLTYGVKLGREQLNATCNAEGTLVYEPVEGTLLDAGEKQELKVTFVPFDTISTNKISKSVYVDVQKAVLTVKANDKIVNYGDTLPVLSFSYSGFINDENAGVLDVLPTITSIDGVVEAGTYPIVVSGGADNNYIFEYENGTLTVKPRLNPVVIWENPSSITYGTALSQVQLNAKTDVAGTFVYTPSDGTVFEAGESQPIIVRFTPADTLTYAVVTDTAFVTVDKATLTVTANDVEMDAGETIPEFTLSYSGFVNGDDESDIDKLPVETSTVKSANEKGVYEITVSGGEDNNYSFVYVGGTLTIKSGDAVKVIEAMSLMVYPNPFTDKVTISSEFNGDGSYQLTDLTGKVISNGQVEDGNTNIMLSHIRKGVYLLQVKMGEGSKTFRLVKQ